MGQQQGSNGFPAPSAIPAHGAMPGLPGHAAPTHGMAAGGAPNGFGNGAQQVDPNYQVLPPHLQPQQQAMPGAQYAQAPSGQMPTPGFAPGAPTAGQGFPQPGGFPMPGGR